MAREISNNDDVIDSRDVIRRIEELESERADLQEALESAESALTECAEVSEGEDSADTQELAQQAVSDARDALKDFDASYEGQELKALRALAEEGESLSDWTHGEVLIRESYFEDYARETAEDMHGEEMRNASWPFSCIDWERAANDLQMDYTSLDFDGVTYYARS